MGQNRKNWKSSDKNMNEKNDYLSEISKDILIEKKLWIKEVIVCLVIIVLIVIREVLLRDFFDFTK